MLDSQGEWVIGIDTFLAKVTWPIIYHPLVVEPLSYHIFSNITLNLTQSSAVLSSQ